MPADHLRLALNSPRHLQHPPRNDSTAETFEDGVPDDDVYGASLVFKRDEDHTVSGARALPQEYQPCNGDPCVLRGQIE